MNDTAASTPNQGEGLALPAFGALLVLIWFIPDLLRSPVVWPFQSVTQMEGRAVIAAVTPPIAGALVLLLFAASDVWQKAQLCSFLVGAVAAFVLLVFGSPAFIVGPFPMLILAAICLAVGISFSFRNRGRFFFFACTALVPAALLGYALWAVIDGRYPSVYLSPLKLPVALFAALSTAGISIRRHFRK